MKRILVIPSGTEIGLEVYDALRWRRDVALIGAESTNNSHASFVFMRNLLVPQCTAKDFISCINTLITDQQVDYIFPAHDDVQLTLLQNRHALKCELISSPLETVEITRFKSRTYSCLTGLVPIPRWEEADRTLQSFPVFVKPNRGQGSQNTHVCNNALELSAALHSAPEMLVCEYLPGREVTVDCFSDRDRGLLFTYARLRARTRAGISVRSEACDVPMARQFAEQIASRLQFFGTWFFQLKERERDQWVLLEVGARIPGGATYQRVRGVNLALLNVFETQRRPITVSPQPFNVTMDRAFISRFRLDFTFRNLYVDFDDTFCLKGDPNVELISLIALARHARKRTVLLSRNPGDCHQWLTARGLAGLFDEVILLDRATPKTLYIEKDGLLIDDSFVEREACKASNILSCDLDAVPALIDLLRRGD